MEKLAGDLLLGLKLVKLEILLTSFIDFLSDKLGELEHLHGIFGWDFWDKWNSLFLPVKTGQNTMLYHLSKMTQLSSVDWDD